MNAPIFTACYADTGVQTLLADGARLRLYPFGEAPQDDDRPYAVWQTVYGNPENYLGNVPDIDSYGIQVDVYAMTASAARSVARALRDAIEPFAHVVSWNGESRDPSTRSYRYSFTVDWFVGR